MEVAKNDRTRELMIVYSSVPYVNNEEDMQFLDNAIVGKKTDDSKYEDILVA